MAWQSVETIPIRGFGFSFDAPVLATVDPWALILSIAAATAIFRYNAGMLQVLAACAGAGVLLFMTGAIP